MVLQEVNFEIHICVVVLDEVSADEAAFVILLRLHTLNARNIGGLFLRRIHSATRIRCWNRTLNV